MPATAKPKRRRLQFSLSALLLAVAALSVWLAKISSEARLQKRVVYRLRELRGEVAYDYELDDRNVLIAGSQPSGPEWLRQRVGDEYFEDVVYASCPKECTDSDFALIAQLPRLRSLKVCGCAITARGLEYIGKVKSLRNLELEGPDIDDNGLHQLENLNELRTLKLISTSVTDDGMSLLSRLTELEELEIHGGHITDVGLANLKFLAKLKRLNLAHTSASDGSLADLPDMRHLETLSLAHTNVTDDGSANLGFLSNLTELDLGNTRITYATIPALLKLRHLQNLNIDCTNIDSLGFEELCHGLPRTYIFWTGRVYSYVPNRDIEATILKDMRAPPCPPTMISKPSKN